MLAVFGFFTYDSRIICADEKNLVEVKIVFNSNKKTLKNRQTQVTKQI